MRALTWVRTGPLDNGYARPIENLITVVDLHAMQVVRVEPGAVVPRSVSAHGAAEQATNGTNGTACH